MRVRARLAVAILSPLFLFFLYRSLAGLKIRYRKAIGLLPDRLIIFGDESSAVLRHKGFLGLSTESTWPEHLCITIYAKCQSFAPVELVRGDQGSVVDNSISNNTSSAPDFRWQLAEWINYEKENSLDVRKSKLFAVSFGTNDIWRYSAFPREEAEDYVEASLDTLFEQLTILKESMRPIPPRILVPAAIDVTLLPAWRNERGQKDEAGFELRNAVYLMRYWNELLVSRARHFGGADIMIWDANLWFVNSVRKGRKAGWDVVTNGCINGANVCSDADRYLLWDGLHFSPKAHQVIAKEIFKQMLWT